MLFNIEEKFSLSRRDQPPARLFRGFKGGAFGGSSLNCINFVVPMNIATTKLIQCGIAEMPENKAFCEFCGCGFLPFRSAAALHGLFILYKKLLP